ncbi:MAG TPA: tyrosine-type recombinase/integrase [Solidesulfovibrio magneticus]|nr:tyrosine-type recombinase/integrase [Solidesulfovibrio magneticus]
MDRKVIKSKYPGVRYREHPVRKHGVKADRYFFIRYKLDGKDKEEGLGWSSEGMTEQKAAARLAELKEAKRTGQGALTLAERRQSAKVQREQDEEKQLQRTKEAIKFVDIFEGPYLEHARHNKKPNSVTTEQGLFNKWLKPVIQDLTLKDISPFHLERVKKTMSDAGLTPRTQYYALCVVRQVFNFARDHEFCDCLSPTNRVKKPSTDNRRLRFLTHDEANQLLRHLSERSPKLHDMALLSLHCGLRAGEIFSLTWGDVDIERDLLALKDTKSGRNRVAYMTTSVRKMLIDKQLGPHGSLVFPGRGGVKRSWVSNAFERAVNELGFNNGVIDSRQKVVFHTLRHTYASWLVEQGIDLYSVKELMGHSTLSMTERYSHLSPQKMRDTIKLFEANIDKKHHVEATLNKFILR